MPTLGEMILQQYKKYIAIASIGAAMAAIGLSLFAKMKKEEKHGWHW
jgi:hypothetical protein